MGSSFELIALSGSVEAESVVAGSTAGVEIEGVTSEQIPLDGSSSDSSQIIGER